MRPLRSRLARLESALAPPPRRLVLEPEDVAIAERILRRAYADPVRHARRVALFDSFLAGPHGPTVR